MKITKDGAGRHVIDLEGSVIDADCDCDVFELFNKERVSKVIRGCFVLKAEPEAEVHCKFPGS